ncbi:uncharacterized protein [Diadema setosum]|uniref:uncharacterized protein n=1 Tax=Diadema setosum TaxID=31175 RepID=UPI003B3B6CC4
MNTSNGHEDLTDTSSPDGRIEEEEETGEEYETDSESGEEYSIGDEEEEEEEDEVSDLSHDSSSPHGRMQRHDGHDIEEERVGAGSGHQAQLVYTPHHQSAGVVKTNGQQVSPHQQERRFVVTSQREDPMGGTRGMQNGGSAVARQLEDEYEEDEEGESEEEEMEDGGEEEGEEEEEEEVEPGMIGPLHIDHVDFILDSIDAELSDLISKNGSGSSEEKKKKRTQAQKRTSPQKGGEQVVHQNGANTGDTNSSEGTLLTPDKARSPQRTSKPSGYKQSKRTSTKGRGTSRGQVTRPSPKLKLNDQSLESSFGGTSDADSISAEEVRQRVVQSLHQQDHTPRNTLPPRHQLTSSQEYHLAAMQESTNNHHNHTTSNNSSPQKITPSPASGNHSKAQTNESNDSRGDDKVKARTQKKKVASKGRTKARGEHASRSSASSDASQQLNHKVASGGQVGTTHLQQGNIGSGINANNNAGGRSGDVSHQVMRLRDIFYDEDGAGDDSERASLATEILLSQPAVIQSVSDLESIATEDFEGAFQRFAMPDSARSQRTNKSNKKLKASQNRGQHSNDVSPTNETAVHQLQRIKGREGGRGGKTKKRTVSAPPIEPSGLPEYMYMHKEVSERDVGADSIVTEEYEPRFLAIPLKHIQTEHPGVVPKKKPSRPRRKVKPGLQGPPQSDPESIQTEDYEARFRSMMVRRLAGVPLSSFDSVTIQSDLDSVKSAEIKRKFRKAIHRPEISGTSSMEEEEVRTPKVMGRSQKTKGSRSSSLRSQSSESLKMKTASKTMKGTPQLRGKLEPSPHQGLVAVHHQAPAMHHSSMPNLSTTLVPGHGYPSTHASSQAPPPPRGRWKSPPRTVPYESQHAPHGMGPHQSPIVCSLTHSLTLTPTLQTEAISAVNTPSGHASARHMGISGARSSAWQPLPPACTAARPDSSKSS